MRHGKTLVKLSRPCKKRRHLLRNLVTSLVEHERICTTRAKARAMRKLADRVITLAKKPHLTEERKRVLLGGILYNQSAVDKVVDELSLRYHQQPGNYSRIRHEKYRRGDGAKMSVIQYRDNPYEVYENEIRSTKPIAKVPEFTLKLLREEVSFLEETLENLKTQGTQDNSKQSFLEKQIDRANRELKHFQEKEVTV